MSLTNITPVGDKQLKYRVKQCSGGTREVFFNQNSEQCSMHTGIFIANIGIFPKHRWLWLLHVQNISSSTIRKPFYKSGCILSISRLSFEFVQIWLNLCSLILLIYLLRTHNKYFCLLLIDWLIHWASERCLIFRSARTSWITFVSSSVRPWAQKIWISCIAL